MGTGDYMLRVKQEIKIYKINWIPVKIKMELYLVYNPTIKSVNVNLKELFNVFSIVLKHQPWNAIYNAGILIAIEFWSLKRSAIRKDEEYCNDWSVE